MNDKIALILSDDLLECIKNAKERAHIYDKDYADGYLHALSEIQSIIESCNTNVTIIETDKEQ